MLIEPASRLRAARDHKANPRMGPAKAWPLGALREEGPFRVAAGRKMLWPDWREGAPLEMVPPAEFGRPLRQEAWLAPFRSIRIETTAANLFKV